MLQRTLLLLLAISVAGVFPACGPNKAKQAAEAKQKILADKKKAAIKNYQDLVKKYPQSEYASKAKERLRALSPSPTPAKK